MKTVTNYRKPIFFTLLVLALFLFHGATVNAQESEPTYKLVGNEIVKVETPKAKGVKTGYTYKIKDVIYPVYKSKRGSYYIERTSKKSGKEYKQYLPKEITDLFKD